MESNFDYDEDAAIAFIRKSVGDDISNRYSDDELLLVIDTIWDYYERKGLTSLSKKNTDDEILDEADLANYVRKEIKSDGEFLMDPADLDKVITAELDYEESIEDA